MELVVNNQWKNITTLRLLSIKEGIESHFLTTLWDHFCLVGKVSNTRYAPYYVVKFQTQGILSNTRIGTQSAILSTHDLRNGFPHTTNLQVMEFALCLGILRGFASCSLHNQSANHRICILHGDPRSMPTMTVYFSLIFFLNHNC